MDWLFLSFHGDGGEPCPPPFHTQAWIWKLPALLGPFKKAWSAFVYLFPPNHSSKWQDSSLDSFPTPETPFSLTAPSLSLGFFFLLFYEEGAFVEPKDQAIRIWGVSQLFAQWTTRPIIRVPFTKWGPLNYPGRLYLSGSDVVWAEGNLLPFFLKKKKKRIG